MIRFHGPIAISKLAELANGRYLAATNEAGSYTVDVKQGSVDLHWSPGAIVVGDKNDVAVVGPIDVAQGVRLAHQVFAGDPLIITDPLTIHAIAACLLAVMREPVEAA